MRILLYKQKIKQSEMDIGNLIICLKILSLVLQMFVNLKLKEKKQNHKGIRKQK